VARIVNVLGVEFYPITLSGACRALDWMLSMSDGKMRVAVTGNPIMVMAARKDPEFAGILRDADLLVPDGVGILWAARKANRELPERVTGVDLTQYLLHKKPSPRVFLLGGKPGVAERAKDRLVKEMPWAKVVGLHHGYFGQAEEAAVVEKVKYSGAEVVLAGMGSPRQEKFLWRNRTTMGAKCAMGVGGVLDILAGDKRLTNPALRRAGLEWLDRLVREPGRIRADLKLVEFAVLVLSQSLFSKGKAREGDQEDDDQGFFDARHV
jgi:N-acetylglucosaminyldiphosphoundecaprenol N-acetyl-beta-D-mannosaminyltransferase